MYVFRRQNRTQKILANKEKAIGSCPHCNGKTEAIDYKEDRVIHKCEECNATIIYTASPIELEKKKRKKKEKYKNIMVRDRSKEIKKEDKEPESEEVPQKKNENGIDTINNSMESRNLLTFEYTSKKGKSSRCVEPYKLERSKAGKIILWAYCTDNEGIRMFYLSRMINLRKQKYQYKPRWDIENKL